jgi:Trp operon repressor
MLSIKSSDLTTELDGTVFKTYKKPKIHKEDCRMEFYLNTSEIEEHSLEHGTAKIFENVFGNVCPAFLNNACKNDHCQKNHSYIDEQLVKQSIENSGFQYLNSILETLFKSHRLLSRYVSVFADIFAHNKNREGLIKLIQGCDIYPRTVECYRLIYNSMVSQQYLQPHSAIRLIIENHKDSNLAREVILQLIFDSGNVAYHMNYVSKVALLNAFSCEHFNTFIKLCVTYQHPDIADTILNVLLTSSKQFREKLNRSYLNNFLELQKLMIQKEKNHELKLRQLIHILTSEN